MSISIGFGAFYAHFLASLNSQLLVGSDSRLGKVWPELSVDYECN